jgi:uncharacterized cupin superfamily protein
MPEKILYGPGGGTMRLVTHCADTGNAHCVLETTEPPGGGPPLHKHTREDEYFFVLEGEFTFWVDGKVIKAPARSAVFGIRNVPHTFKNCSAKQAKMLIVATPGHVEGFFDYALPNPDGSKPTDEILIQKIATLAPKFGIEILGPSPL